MHQRPTTLKLKHITLAISLALTAELALAQELTVIEKIDLGTLQADNSDGSIVFALSADDKVAGGQARDDVGRDRAVIWSGADYATRTDLGTLKADNSDGSIVFALSANGTVAGGWANDDLGNGRAVIWSGAGYATKTDLGTLRADNSGGSRVSALSADGKVAGGQARDDVGRDRAVIWSGADYATKTDLGTLKADNSGRSEVHALSADGMVAGGWADDDVGNIYRAVIWSGTDYATKTDLGTLKADNSGWSEVRALSADGTVAGGSAVNDSRNGRAVIWSGADYATRTDLGTLKADNSDGSIVFALSANGTVAGGWANDDLGNGRAVIWSGDSYATKTDLGTLRADNSGGSWVFALSADGTVVGGRAYDDLGNDYRAVIWSGTDYATKTDLGTLKADNSGWSEVYALSADGMVAKGWANNDQNEWRAALWRLDYLATSTTPVTPPTDTTPVTPPVTPVTPPTDTTPVTPPSTVPVTPPVTPVVISKIDVANTVQTITNLGADSFSLMAMQSHALDRLQYTCRAVQGFCFGTQQDFNVSRDNNDHKIRDIAVGVNAGYGFHNGVSVGVSLDHAINRKLPDSYRHEGDDIGVGAVLRYQSPNGYFGELSGAYDDYTATISRPLLPNTELGVNEANIQGISYSIKVGKEFGDSHRYRAYIGAKQRDISRDAYTENDHTAFPISYGKMTHKDTTATLGLSSHIGMTPKLSWVTDVSGEYRLNDDKPTYTASLTGVEKHDFSYSTEPKKWRGHFATGVRYHVLPTTHLEIMPYVGENATGEAYYGGTLRLESRF